MPEETSLSIVLGKDIPYDDYKILTAIVNSAWGDQITASPEMFQKRFSTNPLFIAAYDNATKEDQDYLANHEINVTLGQRIPVGLLESITISTEGDYRNVPKSYDQLTNCGYWISPHGTPDTLILVDGTGLPTRTGGDGQGNKKGKGEVPFIVSHLKQLLPSLGFDFCWTYTPDIEGVKRWHTKMGGKDTKYVIPHARANWKVPAVNMIDYTHFI